MQVGVQQRVAREEGDNGPEGLPIPLSFVHPGMFVGWLIDHDMIAAKFLPNTAAFKRREITGAKVYEKWHNHLTSDMLTITTRCLDANGAIGDCDVSGCGGLTGAQRPDFVTIAMPNGYTIPLRIPFVLFDPVVLKPAITIPFGGSKL